MAKLIHRPSQSTLLADLRVARRWRDRAIGLIGTAALAPSEGLWIHSCNWIHTFFMAIPIDVIYLDAKMQVVKLQAQVVPWRLPAPVFSATSVIELAAGRLEHLQINIGDQLDVGD